MYGWQWSSARSGCRSLFSAHLRSHVVEFSQSMETLISSLPYATAHTAVSCHFPAWCNSEKREQTLLQWLRSRGRFLLREGTGALVQPLLGYYAKYSPGTPTYYSPLRPLTTVFGPYVMGRCKVPLLPTLQSLIHLSLCGSATGYSVCENGTQPIVLI